MADKRSQQGFGQFRFPTDGNLDQVGSNALELFLNALDQVAPKVRQALLSDVRPVYREVVSLECSNGTELEFGFLSLEKEDQRKRT